MINNCMSASGDQPPKKKPIRKKKLLSEKVITNKKCLPTGGNTQQQVDDVIAQAFTRFYNAANVRQNKLKDLYSLDAVVSEYLQSFMILGYDINGERVCITHAENISARDALIEHLRSTFFNVMNGNNESL